MGHTEGKSFNSACFCWVNQPLLKVLSCLCPICWQSSHLGFNWRQILVEFNREFHFHRKQQLREYQQWKIGSKIWPNLITISMLGIQEKKECEALHSKTPSFGTKKMKEIFLYPLCKHIPWDLHPEGMNQTLHCQENKYFFVSRTKKEGKCLHIPHNINANNLTRVNRSLGEF